MEIESKFEKFVSGKKINGVKLNLNLYLFVYLIVIGTR